MKLDNVNRFGTRGWDWTCWAIMPPLCWIICLCNTNMVKLVFNVIQTFWASADMSELHKPVHMDCSVWDVYQSVIWLRLIQFCLARLNLEKKIIQHVCFHKTCWSGLLQHTRRYHLIALITISIHVFPFQKPHHWLPGDARHFSTFSFYMIVLCLWASNFSLSHLIMLTCTTSSFIWF